MNIQKHCIKNVEESRQGKKIYLIFTDGSKHPQIQNGLDKNRHGNDYLALKYQLEPGIHRRFCTWRAYKIAWCVHTRLNSCESLRTMAYLNAEIWQTRYARRFYSPVAAVREFIITVDDNDKANFTSRCHRRTR